MNTIEMFVRREVFDDDFTLGRLYVDTMHFGPTCEDTDRKMEAGGVKVYGATAIPRGRYRLTATLSQRFGKLMPLIENVPGFEGIRIHGGNDRDDTHGCILLGRTRTDTGVANCAERNATLLKLIVDAEEGGVQCWITVQ